MARSSLSCYHCRHRQVINGRRRRLNEIEEQIRSLSLPQCVKHANWTSTRAILAIWAVKMSNRLAQTLTCGPCTQICDGLRDVRKVCVILTFALKLS